MTDYAALARIHAASFPHDPWTAEALCGLAEGPGGLLLMKPEGFILLRLAGPEAEVLTIAVAPEARRQGIANSLVSEAVATLRQRSIAEVFLEVAAQNSAAQALYKRHGFQEVARRRSYYSNGDDALILRRAVMEPS